MPLAEAAQVERRAILQRRLCDGWTLTRCAEALDLTVEGARLALIAEERREVDRVIAAGGVTCDAPGDDAEAFARGALYLSWLDKQLHGRGIRHRAFGVEVGDDGDLHLGLTITTERKDTP